MAPPDPSRAWTGVFAKRPEPGAVKTRLVGELTAEAAARLQAGMLEDTVARLRAGADRWRAVLAFAPQTERAWFAEHYGDLELVPQRGDDLGERMARFFDDAFCSAARVVMTGSDQPLLGVEALDAAHAALAEGADLVLAPDAGGGYCLVGLARPVPALFRQVEMSTANMCDATIELANRLGLSVHLLEPGLDVDDATDLERLVTDLARPPYPLHTAATRRALEELGRLERR